LIIAQHRDKRNHLSGIKLPALREGLECVHYAAKARGGMTLSNELKTLKCFFLSIMKIGH
jgi:hypothetical protein